ncbi:MAG: hypothetical protein WDO73_16935 [Ignavibacteriota bacterium]
MNGLKILLMLTSNWDVKDSRDGKGSNTAIYSKPGPQGAQLYYAFDDWGATFGKWGGFFSRDKWNAAGFSKQTSRFVNTPDGQTIRWGYSGSGRRTLPVGSALTMSRGCLRLSPR